MKEVALHQMEAVADATLSLSKGVHKTLINCSREVAKVADELCEFSDIDDIFKSVEDHSEKGMSANNLSGLSSSNKQKFRNIFGVLPYVLAVNVPVVINTI